MSHQLYESWILDDVPLSDAQRMELNSHLSTCAECSSLQSSWSKAREELQTVSVKQPAAGFSMRWRSSLKDRRLAEERDQQRSLWIGIASAFASILIGFMVVLSPHISWVQLFVGISESVVNLTAAVSTLIQIVSSVVHAVPPFALVLTGLALSTLLSVTIFLWGASIWRISRRGLTFHEKN
jgi:anti-sigma factor RsiW